MTATPPQRTCYRTDTRARVLLVLLGLLGLPALLRAQAASPADLRKQAAEAEKRRDWREACRAYDEILHRDRGRDDVRQKYQYCLRRYYVVRRHQDPLYREALSRLTPAQALEMYEQVLGTIARVYVDRQKTDPAELFRQGLDELGFALEETAFRREHFADVKPASLDAFKARLAEWRSRKIAGRAEARDQVRAVGRLAQQTGVAARPAAQTALTLEFLSGACNALDEYTFFLTPGRFREVQDTLRGRLVSVGVDLTVIDGELVIGRVYPHGPAWEAQLARYDRVLRIDGRPTDGMPAEAAAERLRGKPDSEVVLEVISASRMGQRVTIRLTRRPVVVPSVESELLARTLQLPGDYGMDPVHVLVGRITISHFQESTPQEVREALASLQTDGAKVLILDLRGNPGGLFRSAVQVADQFLPDGIVVVSQSQVLSRDRRLSGPIKAEGVNPSLLPMVVLIDGETASSAEVLAGALKDNGRAKLVGQTTFGKGTIQCVIPLDRSQFQHMPGGLRITVAKLLSPSWQPYSGKGIQPNFPTAADGDALLAEAVQILREELLRTLQPMVMPN